MYGFESAHGSSRAVILVGTILGQTLLLYAGYGWLERLVAPKLVPVIENEE